jgi:uncharacterized Fe-S center protein
MAQNKLKQKVEALTRVVQQLIKEVQINASLAQGTLTAFQLHLGEKEWNKLVEELKDKEKRLEIPEEEEELPPSQRK